MKLDLRNNSDFTVEEFVSDRQDIVLEHEVPEGPFYSRYERTKFFDVPCAYRAYVRYKGQPILLYRMATPYYAEYLDERYDDLDDVCFSDESYFDYVWEESNLCFKLEDTFLYQVFTGFDPDYPEVDTDEIIAHDSSEDVTVMYLGY